MQYLFNASSCSLCSLCLFKTLNATKIIRSKTGIKQASTIPVVIPAWRESYSSWPVIFNIIYIININKKNKKKLFWLLNNEKINN